MDDNFLEPADDTPVSVATPEEQMPGLAGHLTNRNGYKHLKTLEESTIIQHSTEIQKNLKYLLRLPKLKF